MKTTALKEVEVVVCDLCSNELDTGFYGINSILDNEANYASIGISSFNNAEWHHFCKACYQDRFLVWLESQKIKPTV